jgi:deazaflavin-dependent oxidoreductase (nitroreductase family)
MTFRIDFTKPGWQDQHRDVYLRTKGAEGHLADFTVAGGSTETPCLILKTTGRRSGEAKVLPLIYGNSGADFVIVASKGGAPSHPAWFLNLEANSEVEFQVADKAYRGIARVTQGAERGSLYKMMEGVYPPYTEYQARTDREIPVVVLEPKSTIDGL